MIPLLPRLSLICIEFNINLRNSMMWHFYISFLNTSCSTRSFKLKEMLTEQSWIFIFQGGPGVKRHIVSMLFFWVRTMGDNMCSAVNFKEIKLNSKYNAISITRIDIIWEFLSAKRPNLLPEYLRLRKQWKANNISVRFKLKISLPNLLIFHYKWRIINLS